MVDAFYLPLSAGRFQASPRTAGPWGPEAQHAGPPAALLARTMLAAAERPGLHVPRVSFELLRPVAVGEVEVTATVVRPGRAITLVEGALAVGGQPAMLGRAWLCAPAPDEGRAATRPLPAATEVPPADDADIPPLAAWPGAHMGGYLGSFDWASTAGAFNELGAGGMWMRPHVELVAGTRTSPLELALLVADSGSGVGLSHDLDRVMAINIDLTVFFDRFPQGHWIHLDAHTTGTAGGGSFSSTTLADAGGRFARGVQSLYVQRTAST